jgi:hypothetical protein
VALVLVAPVATAAGPPHGLVTVATALEQLERDATALTRHANEVPEAQLGMVSDEERFAIYSFTEAYAELERSFDGPVPVSYRRLHGSLVDKMESGFSALRDYATARQRRDRAGMREAAENLRATAAAALELLGHRNGWVPLVLRR